MNPYASNLGERDPLQVIAQTPAELARLLDATGLERAELAPAPGKWSLREVLCHLADCELVFGYRLRQTLAKDHHTIQPFDQEMWAKPYAAYPARTALAVFSSIRGWNLALFRSLQAEAFAKPVTHPERGDMTFQTLVDTMAGHDLNHLRRLEEMAAAAASAR